MAPKISSGQVRLPRALQRRHLLHAVVAAALAYSIVATAFGQGDPQPVFPRPVGYPGVMPSVEAVSGKVQGDRDPFMSHLRQAAAFHQLVLLVGELSEGGEHGDIFTPEERALMEMYHQASRAATVRASAILAAEGGPEQGYDSPGPRTTRAFAEVSDERLREELVQGFFPEYAARYLEARRARAARLEAAASSPEPLNATPERPFWRFWWVVAVLPVIGYLVYRRYRVAPQRA